MLKKQLEEAVWNRQVLEQKLAWTQSEKNELEEHFMAAILEVQQKANNLVVYHTVRVLYQAVRII